MHLTTQLWFVIVAVASVLGVMTGRGIKSETQDHELEYLRNKVKEYDKLSYAAVDRLASYKDEIRKLNKAMARRNKGVTNLRWKVEMLKAALAASQAREAAPAVSVGTPPVLVARPELTSDSKGNGLHS